MMSKSAKPELANSSAWLEPEILTAGSEEGLKVLYFFGSAMLGFSPLYPIDKARCKACAEAVVYINHGDAAGAGVEHAEQRRQAVEARAVADARRHGDHRLIDEARDDARQRALHARDDEE